MTKFCHRCQTEKAREAFGKNKARTDGLQVYCRSCMKDVRIEKGYDKARWEKNRESESARNREYRTLNADHLAEGYRAKAARRRLETPWRVNAVNKARKASQLSATPAWSDKDQISVIYKKARELSSLYGVPFQVDHIVPLRGKTVSGLHVPANLQLLAADLNHKKRNYVWPDMP